jgi:hypothetical protein
VRCNKGTAPSKGDIGWYCIVLLGSSIGPVPLPWKKFHGGVPRARASASERWGTGRVASFGGGM